MRPEVDEDRRDGDAVPRFVDVEVEEEDFVAGADSAEDGVAFEEDEVEDIIRIIEVWVRSALLFMDHGIASLGGDCHSLFHCAEYGRRSVFDVPGVN